MRLKKFQKVLIALAAVIIIAFCGWTAYVNDYYHALSTADTAISQPEDGLLISTDKDNSIVFYPDGADSGIIFYPGAKVEYTAYAPLLKKIAADGYLCILVKMPQNMAIFNVDAAAGIVKNYPEISHWYLAGHSLGGAMAANCISKHAEDFEGLILLGAYSVSDLNGKNVDILSIRGSNDMVCSQEKYDKARKNLPEDRLTEYLIDGGCHAYFGCYGEQKGDGQATISNEEQMEETTACISDWIGRTE